MKESDPFEKGLAAGEAAASAAGGASETSKTSKRMYVRTQGFGSTDAELRFLQRCGVHHKAATFPFPPDRGCPSTAIVITWLSRLGRCNKGCVAAPMAGGTTSIAGSPT